MAYVALCVPTFLWTERSTWGHRLLNVFIQSRDLLVFQFYVLSTSDSAPEDQDG